MRKIEGKEIAEKILERLQGRKTKKFFAAFLVGNDPASRKFQEQKKKTADMLGVDYRIYSFPENILQDELRKKIHGIASSSACGGAIIQLPLPPHIDAQYALNVIPREKDVDVLGERALGAYYAGRNPILPPAVGTFEEILSTLPIELSESNVAIMGLGKLIGRPIAHYVMQRAKNIFLLDKGSDFHVLKQADIVVLGTGTPGVVRADMAKDGCAVIDFGYGTKNGETMGDFDVGSGGGNIAYTPTPGGTGPVLVAKLFENFFALQSLQSEAQKKPHFFKAF